MRPSAENTWFDIARIISNRSTCPKRHVGAVLIKDNHLLATGYNGSAPQEPHCDEVGCFLVNGHCERTIHAEVNTILQAAKFGLSVKGSTLYCTVRPCSKCQMYLRAAGINDWRWRETYEDRPGAPVIAKESSIG